MSKSFEDAISFVMKHEGGFVNHKKDAGGATNYGISLRFLKSAGIDIDGDSDSDIDDILAIDKQKASEIYKTYWWDRYGYDRIQDSDIAKKVFDLAVNMGAPRAHKLTQISVNRLRDKPIAVDGILGRQSFEAINELIKKDKSRALYLELIENACHFYTNLVADNPELKVFLKGWINRARD